MIMKKTYAILMALAMLSSGVLLTSCHERLRPDGDGDQDETIITPKDEYIALPAAQACYYGDYAGNGTANYYVALYEGNLDKNGYFVGESTCLFLDLYALGSSPQDAIPAGTYLASREAADGVFVIGGEDNSRLFIQNKNNDSDTMVLTDGTVEISRQGNKYSIVVDAKTASREVKYSYVGAIEVVSGVKDWDAVLVDDIAQGEMDYCGNVYEDQAEGTAVWCIYLANSKFDMENFSGEGLEVCIEVIAEDAAGLKAVPAGHYDLETLYSDGAVAGSVIPGQTDDEGYYGTWYFEWNPINLNNDLIYAATDGYVDIERLEGDKYKIGFEFFDDEYYGSFSGTYEGKFGYYDATAASEEASAKSLRSLSRPGAAVMKSAIRPSKAGRILAKKPRK